MTKEELMALLRDPDQTGQSVDELNRLIKEHSYFHTGHQLYLQSLKKTNETQLALQLTKSAMNVRDRGLLYNYINRPSVFRQQITPQEDIEEVMTPFVPGNAYVSPDADIHHIQQAQVPTITEQAGTSTLVGLNEIRQDSEIHVQAEEKIMSDAELATIIQHQLNQINQSQTQDTPVGNAETIRPVYSEAQLTSDLASISQAVEPIPPEVNPPVKKEPIETMVDVLDKNEVAKTPHDLINSFLQSNPKIIPSDDIDYEIDLTQSLQEDLDIATEILADIYVSQGYKQKAIEIYEHLILKYPEKHIYFASQIDRLK